jgi:hypothetical protein
MQQLIRYTNLRWTGFYLGPTPNHPDAAWMDKRQTLMAIGWGFAPTYLGRQVDSKHLDEGAHDGNEAADLAMKAGFPAGSVVYLDWEDTNGGLNASSLKYCSEWAAALTKRRFVPGVYCAARVAQSFPNGTIMKFIWVFLIGNRKGKTYNSPMPASDPASACAGARLWQYAQKCSCHFIENGQPVELSSIDFNSSTVADPSVAS